MQTERHLLLIQSVGGTPDPIAFSIRSLEPACICFVHSAESKNQIGIALDAVRRAGGPSIQPGQIRQFQVRDAQNFEETVRDLRRLAGLVREWCGRGEAYEVVVDFTGGTKVMSAALALVARRWTCTFGYVGSGNRTKGGLGTVEPGAERLLIRDNPWDTLGYQAAEEAVAVFNSGGYAAAGALLEVYRNRASKPEVKHELSTLKFLVDAYASWDCFDYKKAAHWFAKALENRNDLNAIFAESQSLIARLEHHRELVVRLGDSKEPTVQWVADLFRNAERRAGEGRFDDAVARLYRVAEAFAQIRLRDSYGIRDTGSVPLDRIPESLRREWEGRAEGGAVALGLQDDYRLLKELGDEVGRRFFEDGLAGARSPLGARNSSILAHGFEPINKRQYDRLREGLDSVLKLDARSEPWTLPPIQ